MSESRSVFVFGYSGHSYVVIESLLDLGYEIKGYFDTFKAQKNPYLLDYFGFEREVDVKSIVGESLVFPAVGDIQIRKKLVDFFDCLGLNQFSIIDKSAKVSKSTIINPSSYVGKNVVVNAQSKIGKGVILNSSCVIEHECRIADFVHIAPGCVLCGNVEVGEDCFIGANSTVKQNVSIIGESLIGASSLIVKDLLVKGLWYGNPVSLR